MTKQETDKNRWNLCFNQSSSTFYLSYIWAFHSSFHFKKCSCANIIVKTINKGYRHYKTYLNKQNMQLYGCESWTVKRAERQRIDAFELWCWRRLWRVPWTARRSNQSILKEISPGISLEVMMLKLKLQYLGHLMWRVDSLEKTLMLGGIGGRRRRGTTEDEMAGWHHWLNGRESEWTPGDGDGQGGLACCDSWGRKESDTTERLNWTELNWTIDWFRKYWRFKRFSIFLPSVLQKCMYISCLLELCWISPWALLEN